MRYFILLSVLLVAACSDFGGPTVVTDPVVIEPPTVVPGPLPPPTVAPKPVCPGVIVADGNSLTDSVFNKGHDWFTLAGDWHELSLTKRVNWAYPQATTEDLIERAWHVIDPLLKVSGTFHVEVYWEGSNDLSYGAGVDSTIKLHQRYARERRAAGWTIILASVLPRIAANIPSMDFEIQRQQFNAWLRANWATIADGFVDVGNDPKIGAMGANTNGAYYNADLTHLNADGQEAVARLMRPAVDSAIAASCH